MTGPPDHALEKIPDRAAVEQFVSDHTPPFRVGYRQGDDIIEEQFDLVDTSRGGGLAELHYPGGRYVTVDVVEELNHIAEVQ